MKKFRESKVTNLEDLEKRKAKEADEKAQKENKYVGNVFKVSKYQIGLFKLKKYLKGGTEGDTYDKLLRPSSSAPNLKPGEGHQKGYTFQKQPDPADEENPGDSIKQQLIDL